jgi:hypothetical protein
MTKSELMKLLEKVSDNAEIFVVTKEYDEKDDLTWMPDFQSEIAEVKVNKKDDEITIVVDCNEFM